MRLPQLAHCQKFANLDIVALVTKATFPKEAMGDNTMNVKFIQDRISILG